MILYFHIWCRRSSGYCLMLAGTCNMPSSTHWTPKQPPPRPSHAHPASLSPSPSPCKNQETGVLPLRQTPSRSQVELPVTMRQPLETDGLQTACHVYCCCHKRQESNNTLPQEPHGISQGPANTCLGRRRGVRGWGGVHWPCAWTHTHTHINPHTLTPTLTTLQMPLLQNTHTLGYAPWYGQKQPGTHTPNVLRQPVRTCYIYCN